MSPFRSLVRWTFVEPKLAWASIVIPPLILQVCLLLICWPEELRVRTAGFVLTVVGFGGIIAGVLDTQRSFDKPSYKVRFAAWFWRFPLRRRDAIAGVSSASALTMGSSGRAIVRASAVTSS